MSNRIRVEKTAIASWEEADQALRRVGEIDIEVERNEGERDLIINQHKDVCARACTPLLTEKEQLVAQLQQFAEARKDELTGKGKKKTMKLIFGSLGFRASTRLVKLAEDGEIIALLREFGYPDCVRVTEAPDLAAIKKLDEESIEEVGCGIDKLDAFWLEPDRQKIEELRG